MLNIRDIIVEGGPCDGKWDYLYDSGDPDCDIFAHVIRTCESNNNKRGGHEFYIVRRSNADDPNRDPLTSPVEQRTIIEVGMAKDKSKWPSASGIPVELAFKHKYRMKFIATGFGSCVAGFEYVLPTT